MKNTLLLALLLASITLAQTRVAAVGNSITAGMGIPNAYEDGYPAVLQKLLGSSYQVQNFGHSGATMLKKGDLPYWNQTAFTNAKAFLPQIVVIELGTNDSKSYNWYARPTEFPVDYKSMIEVFQGLSSKPEIWICLAPFSNNPPWQITDTSLTKRINPDILQVGLAKGVHVIDLHSTLTDHSGFQADSVHPNAKGAAEIAAIVRSHLLNDTLEIQQTGTTLSAPSGFGFQWYKNGNPISGATTQNISITETGSYSASVKIAANIDSRIVTNSLNVTDLSANSSAVSSSETSPSSSGNVATIPNANKSSQWLQLSGMNLRIQLLQNSQILMTIYDIQGHQMQQTSIQGHTGMNTYPLPQHKGLRIVDVQVGQEHQTVLIRSGE